MEQQAIQPSARILVVDDSFAIRDVLRRRLEREGYLVETAASGEEVPACLAHATPDLVLLDVVMPGASGLEVCAKLKADPATRLLPVVLMTTLESPEVRLESAEALLFSLAAIVEARDAYTGGLLHDLGKIAVPDSVLNKRGPLSSEEYDLMKAHPVVGDQLCSRLRSLGAVRPIVRHHHEMLDGSGYPDGLHGDEVPLLAQIMGIADAFDALTSGRPYRHAQPAAVAVAQLRDDVARGRRAPELVETFIDCVVRRTAGLTD
ncbi:MAG: response regulator [Acidobacteria bacterium]|nr:response regulator [Acidobacteriota bacterium]